MSDFNPRPFLLGLFGSIVVLALLFMAASEVLIRRTIDGHHPLFHKLAVLRNGTAQDVALGASKINWGFTGQPGFLNLARVGTVQGMLMVARSYFTQRPVGRVIVAAEPHEFSPQYQRQEGEEGAAENLVLTGPSPLRVLDPVYGPEIFLYWRRLLQSGPTMFMADLQSDGSQLQHSRFSDLSAGDRLSAVYRTALSLRPHYQTYHDKVESLYRQLIDFLHQRGGTVCLVQYPFPPDMLSQMGKMPEYQQVRAFYAQLAQQTNSRFVDLSDMDLPVSLFADPTHLNAEGARFVSPLVVQRCFP